MKATQVGISSSLRSSHQAGFPINPEDVLSARAIAEAISAIPRDAEGRFVDDRVPCVVCTRPTHGYGHHGENDKTCSKDCEEKFKTSLRAR